MGIEKAKSCVHCGNCKEKCIFLNKYDLDLEGFSNTPTLAYHCFLCNACEGVCEQGISGKKIAEELRAIHLKKEGQKNIKKDYRAILWEKNDYLFKNYRGGKKSSIFMGCNFPGFFPKTTREIEAIGRTNQMGIIYDCCGKPVGELGLEKDAKKILKTLEKNLRDKKVEELITICPNCYYYLKDKLEIPVLSIYSKLELLGVTRNERQSIPMFFPCPDRKTREFIQPGQSYFGTLEDGYTNIQCCGLGGCAGKKEPQLAMEMGRSPKETDRDIYTYCASCVGNFSRKGKENVYHLLPHLLHVTEKSESGIRPFLNRAVCKVRL